jgi:uncharacterized protein
MDSQTRERRVAEIEVRAKGRRLEGYAALFGIEARIGSFTESIRAGAFTDALAKPDILALVDHDPARVLARTRSGTLRLSQDAKGLAFALDVPDTQAGHDVLALAERGDVGGMSFGFVVPAGGDSWQGDARELRTIDLFEISVVLAWPAYDGTVVNARAMTQGKPWRLNLAQRYLETMEGGL